MAWSLLVVSYMVIIMDMQFFKGKGTLICGLPCYGHAADDGQSMSSKGGPMQSVCTHVSADMQGFLQEVLVRGVADQVTFADAPSA